MKNIILTGDSVRKNLAALWGRATELPGTWRHSEYIIWDAPAHGSIRMYPSDSVDYTIIVYDAKAGSPDNVHRYIEAVHYLKGDLARTCCLILREEGVSILVNNVIRKCKQAGIKYICVPLLAGVTTPGVPGLPTLEHLFNDLNC